MALVMSRPERELETRLTARDAHYDDCGFPMPCREKEEKREALAATEEVEKRDEERICFPNGYCFGKEVKREGLAATEEVEKRDEERICFPNGYCFGKEVKREA